MKVVPTLWKWQFRSVLPITGIATAISLLYTLFEFEPLRFETSFNVWLFIAVHCGCLAVALGRTGSRSFGFLYSQGFPRDVLWRHVLLTSAASVFVVACPVVLLLATGLRSRYQEWTGNYWYPLMSGTEWPFVVWSLLAYAVLIPVFHYAWIRAALPVRGQSVGGLIVIGALFAAVSIWNGVSVPSMPLWTVWFMAGSFVLASLSLAIGGQKLHRRLEVRS